MKITVATLSDLVFNVDVEDELELENFKATCEAEAEIPASEIVIVLNGRPLLDDKKSLKAHGIRDGDVVILQQHKLNSSPGSSRTNATRHGTVPADTGGGSSATEDHLGQARDDDPARIRDQILANPEHLALLKQNNPHLADAMLNDFPKFTRMIHDMQRVRKEREVERLRLMTADAFDVEAQTKIAEEIRRKNIDANMEAAMEFNPESFATVCMLYINCKVNGVPVKAFIDSGYPTFCHHATMLTKAISLILNGIYFAGAQTTIMSTECAERCNIMRLLDTRFSGVAKGVGTQRIIGRVHMVQVEINGAYLTSGFAILADQKMDMLLGLDMLKRHQCVIDLQKGVLKIGTTNTEAAFLPEAELPEFARMTGPGEDEVDPEDLAEDIELSKAIEDSAKEHASSQTEAGRHGITGTRDSRGGTAGHSSGSRSRGFKNTVKKTKHG